MKKIFLTICLLSVAFIGTLSSEARLGKKIAQLPSVKTASGELVDWAKYTDKVLVFEWVNPDCPFVKRHYREGTMKKIQDPAADDMQWFGVNSTHYMSAADTQAWKQEHKLDWPIIIDQDGSFGHFFGAKTTPHVFVLAKDRRLLYRGAIDDDPYGKKAFTHRTMYVANVLKGIKAGQLRVQANKPYGCSVKYRG